jgi:micrococcal nuclease
MMRLLTNFLIFLSVSGCYNGSDFEESSTKKPDPKIEVETEAEALIVNKFASKVVAIQDGDTIELRLVYTGKEARDRQNKNIRIRFAHIDTPERGKPFYKVATQFTANHCFGEDVTILHNGEFDRYGRLIGEVILPNGQNLNKMLVKEGLAVHFKKYSDSEEYAQLEVFARQKKIGLWRN